MKVRYFTSIEFEELYYDFHDDLTIFYRFDAFVLKFERWIWEMFGGNEGKLIFRLLALIFLMCFEIAVVIASLAALRAFFKLTLKIFRKGKFDRKKIKDWLRQWLKKFWQMFKDLIERIEKLFKDWQIRELVLALSLAIVLIINLPSPSIDNPDVVVENIIPRIELISNYRINDNLYSQSRIKMNWPNNVKSAPATESKFSELITLGELNNSLSDNLVDVSSKSDKSEVKPEIKIFKFFKKKMKLKNSIK